MVRRTKKTTKKSPAKRVVKRKKTSSKKADPATAANQKAQWTAYKELQEQVDKAWAKLKTNVKNKVKPQILIQDKNELLLLLGECNYMASECMRLSGKKGRK